MQVHTDDEMASLGKQELLQIFTARNIALPNDLSVNSLRTTLKERVRLVYGMIIHLF